MAEKPSLFHLNTLTDDSYCICIKNGSSTTVTDVMRATKKTKKPKAPKLFPDELIDQLLTQVQNKNAESILGESGLVGQFKKQLAERMLAAELTHHLDTEAAQGKPGNHRNGSNSKSVITPSGELNLDIPRDRQAMFEPQFVAKYQRRLPGFGNHVISMYARFRCKHSAQLTQTAGRTIAKLYRD